MNEPQPVVGTLERAIFVESCEEGWNPRSIVRIVVWHGDDVHEELSVFPSLREALDYAREAYASSDGPALAAR
jgi:hypothetical protein